MSQVPYVHDYWDLWIFRVSSFWHIDKKDMLCVELSGKRSQVEGVGAVPSLYECTFIQ